LKTKLQKLSLRFLNFVVSLVRFRFRKLISNIFIGFCTPLDKAIEAAIYLFENMVKPCEMPRPLALTGTTVHTETLPVYEMTKQK